MKKSVAKFDCLTNTLTISESFYKKSQVYGSEECVQLKAMMAENAGCKIAIEYSTKKTYKGLTLALIREYIKIQENVKVLETEMAEVRVKALEGKEGITEKMADKIAFPLIKKWFLMKFKDFSVSRAQKEISEYKVKQAEAVAATKLGVVIPMPQKDTNPAVNQ